MIINTDKLRLRKLNGRPYIAIYGTQPNPISANYDLLDDEEAADMASALSEIADSLKDEARRLRVMIIEIKQLTDSNL